jgi:hypothetical protein
MPKRVALAAARTFTTPAARYPPDPRALFILSLCVFVGVPLIFANATPGTIAAKLDAVWVVVWGLMLSAGSLLALVGALRQTVNGVILEQVGSVSVGFACVIYGTAIWLAIGVAGSVPIVIVAGWGVSCFWRWGQLQGYLRDVERLARKARGA